MTSPRHRKPINTVRFAHPAESLEAIPSVPDAHLEREITALQARLEAHMARRPHWHDINARARWSCEKDALEKDLTMLRRQRECRWRPVEGRTA
ncbi:MAG TPA: hypothetical protein VK150_08980 [Geothrix sp.]|nr:hypothetical protein [Geothrix sp.]